MSRIPGLTNPPNKTILKGLTDTEWWFLCEQIKVGTAEMSTYLDDPQERIVRSHIKTPAGNLYLYTVTWGVYDTQFGTQDLTIKVEKIT